MGGFCFGTGVAGLTRFPGLQQPNIAAETDGLLPSLLSECREGGVRASRTPNIARVSRELLLRI